MSHADKYDYRLTMLTVVASIMAIYVILSVAYIVQQRLKTQGLYQSPSPVDDMTGKTISLLSHLLLLARVFPEKNQLN